MSSSASRLKYRVKQDTLFNARRFIYLLRNGRRINTFENHGDWTETRQRALKAIEVWCRIYPPDELSLMATDEEWLKCSGQDFA